MIYVVIGTTGEYSDRREWLVRAYASRKEAERFITEMDEILLAKKIRHEDDTFNIDWEHQQRLVEEMRDIDPKFQLDYTGTNYYMEEVEFEQ